MAKATITLQNGLSVILEGSPKEISEFLEKYGDIEAAQPRNSKTTRMQAADKTRKDGPTEYILRLKADKFFSERRSLSDIRNALEVGGHIYPITTLSPVLVRLVRRRDLRRLKGERGWVYVSS
ncbi:MAG: hypothetical protein JST16_03890 [Bdellovibrionales bacterium]|nr:hypothetical protein [Bdellovibrionales bacterium]